MKTCSFCREEINKANRAVEHVVPEWLLDMLEIDREEKHRSYRRHFEGKITTERSFGARNIVYGAVCSTCNNGWMSNLEGQVKLLFERLFEIRPTEITEVEAKSLSRWAYKTAALLALTADEPCQNLIDLGSLVDIRTGDDPPDNVQVSLLLAIPPLVRKAETVIHEPGFIQTEAVVFSRQQFEDLINVTVGYVVMLQFGPVVLRVTSVNPRAVWQMLDSNRTPFYSLTDRPKTLDWPPKIWQDKRLIDLARGVTFRLRT